ncbi:fimbrial protein [Enterobacter asburiae]
MMFNVRKTASSCAIAVALFATSSGAYVYAAPGASAEVKFRATVTESTCTPSWNATNGITIDFAKVRSEELNTENGIAKRQFTLTLTNCQNVTGVQVSAAGTPDANKPDAFANTAQEKDAAKNVAFVLLAGPDQNTPLKPNSGSSVEYKMPTNATSIEMPFVAELVPTGTSPVEAGTATGVATLNMTYE